ncbi:MAG: SH3 domain-containing protein [Clostridia bacterium]|nr:SH3 domain-containing protein [Clostridia bacterium]
MRRLLLVLLLCLLPVMALAEEVPDGVMALIDEYYGQRLPVEFAEVKLSDGRRVGIAIAENRNAFQVENRGDGWTIIGQDYVMDELYPAYPEVAAQDGQSVCIAQKDNTVTLTYRYDGERFRLAAWVIPGYLPVTVEGDVLTYDTGRTPFTTVVPGGVTDWPYWAEDLPLSPQEAMDRAAISEQNAAEMFPGYTLRDYQAFNDGAEADVVYSRISNGVLLIRRVKLQAGLDPVVTDAMPVALSESLLARLETEPFDDLIWCWTGGDTFLTQVAFDLSQYPLPEGAVILQNRIETHSLVVLARVEGVKYLYVFENGPAYVSQPLPEDAGIDFFHAGSGDLEFEWAQQNMSASFTRREDGRWLLSWCTCYGPSMDIHFSANAFGIRLHDAGADGEDVFRVGTMASTDLFTINLSELNGATPELDQSGWAVVSNPDPADRLHLRDRAGKSGNSLGKFYNGTPVLVLERKGDWTRVQIGFGATARTGWMMTKYLTFGADMDTVADAFPELIFREEYEAQGTQLGYDYWVVGVEEEGRTKQYILLGSDGMVMYVDQAWLWGGNG